MSSQAEPETTLRVKVGIGIFVALMMAATGYFMVMAAENNKASAVGSAAVAKK